MINDFHGKNFFLSNFYRHKVVYNGLEFDNNEAAFQAQKTLDSKIQEDFIHLLPDEAKSLGRSVKLRNDWEQVKDTIMEEIVRAKFNDPYMKKLLLATGDEELIEGNWWKDRYWGVCNGTGKNKLGKILMKIRKEIK